MTNRSQGSDEALPSRKNITDEAEFERHRFVDAPIRLNETLTKQCPPEYNETWHLWRFV
jgi:hypothetical protein